MTAPEQPPRRERYDAAAAPSRRPQSDAARDAATLAALTRIRNSTAEQQQLITAAGRWTPTQYREALRLRFALKTKHPSATDYELHLLAIAAYEQRRDTKESRRILAKIRDEREARRAMPRPSSMKAKVATVLDEVVALQKNNFSCREIATYLKSKHSNKFRGVKIDPRSLARVIRELEKNA